MYYPITFRYFNRSFEEYVEVAEQLAVKLDLRSPAATAAATSPAHDSQPFVSVLVFTDDIDYVDAHARAYNKKGRSVQSAGGLDFRIRAVGSRGQPSPFDRYTSTATADFLDLLLSLQMAGQCSGFVGNFESNVSDLLFQWMCLKRSKRGEGCPAFVALGANAAWTQLGR